MNHFYPRSTRDWILTFFLAAWFAGFSAFAQDPKQQDLRQTGNMELLNLWEQPAAIRCSTKPLMTYLQPSLRRLCSPFQRFNGAQAEQNLRAISAVPCWATSLKGAKCGAAVSRQG